jgi:hypothetical protein
MTIHMQVSHQITAYLYLLDFDTTISLALLVLTLCLVFLLLLAKPHHGKSTSLVRATLDFMGMDTK